MSLLIVGILMLDIAAAATLIFGGSLGGAGTRRFFWLLLFQR